MRLTKEVELFNGAKTFKKNDTISNQEVIIKLGQAEVFEEELGFNLITFLKALSDGIYAIYERTGKITAYTSACCVFDFDSRSLIVIEDFDGDNWNVEERYYLKDYGKTWALTKEELTNGTK